MKITEIAKQFKRVNDLSDPLFLLYKNDSRKGVQAIVRKVSNRIMKNNEKITAFHERFRYENTIWEKGVTYIAGVDEVGRGPLAGPVVSGAVIIPKDFDVITVNDSKKLSDQQRRDLIPLIKQEALSYNCAEISSQVIDEVNIYEATKIAMKQAIEGLSITPEHIIVDAMSIDIEIPQTKLIKGDSKSISVAAASIIAKVTRDDLMIKYSQKYSEYGFEKNDGYGTKQHLIALQKFGATPIHRKSFAPVKNLKS
ncbi:ribonuclease HII [Fructilactobacillus lindneri]|uniref:Ribonuclease HII n=2 Tax=Fructilactobacillus lindneri TaxID=53444 RepID=A0A0R2JPA2_9LACO|nr:ribonuclease HII [Fructilactobacillus lindneri]ANZ58166.1 ribonuclease HII [Fructilactobacillus lindneri]ANZ59487.1 ribonuclease HII [Fructilactobacillus lindneri]KRN78987.1 ribonuclease HII [Fructilactobacillus lindneri DSM 20690 = JCM 11027]POG98729.1 ribonuclease HII [Fructilactobacillus lindneri]POH03002.1 ribonuclease HII [Fructilactobacillus lindneri]